VIILWSLVGAQVEAQIFRVVTAAVVAEQGDSALQRHLQFQEVSQ
jgi:hypothetical protein